MKFPSSRHRRLAICPGTSQGAWFRSAALQEGQGAQSSPLWLQLLCEGARTTVSVPREMYQDTLGRRQGTVFRGLEYKGEMVTVTRAWMSLCPHMYPQHLKPWEHWVMLPWQRRDFSPLDLQRILLDLGESVHSEYRNQLGVGCGSVLQQPRNVSIFGFVHQIKTTQSL